jgi:hypothetical protein
MEDWHHDVHSQKSAWWWIAEWERDTRSCLFHFSNAEEERDHIPPMAYQISQRQIDIPYQGGGVQRHQKQHHQNQ